MSDPNFETCPTVDALQEASYILDGLNPQVSQVTIETEDSILTYHRCDDDPWTLIGTRDP